MDPSPPSSDAALLQSLAEKYPSIPIPPPRPTFSPAENASYYTKYYSIMAEHPAMTELVSQGSKSAKAPNSSVTLPAPVSTPSAGAPAPDIAPPGSTPAPLTPSSLPTVASSAPTPSASSASTSSASSAAVPTPASAHNPAPSAPTPAPPPSKPTEPAKPAQPTVTAEILAAYSPIKNNPGPPANSYWATHCFRCESRNTWSAATQELEKFSDVMVCRHCASELFPNKRHQKNYGHGTINRSETVALFDIPERAAKNDIKFSIAYGVGPFGAPAYSYRIADILDYIKRVDGGLLARKRKYTMQQ